MFNQLVITNLFTRNVATVQLLGLCPLLAMSHTMETASLLALASSVVLIGSSVVVASFRSYIPETTRLPIFVLVIATFVSVLVLLIEAFAFTLYVQVALFLQIIVTNCMILGRINQQTANKSSFRFAFLDSVTTAMGFSVVLITFGGMREFGALVLPILAQPAGAFVAFGLLIALIRYNNR